MKPIDCFPKDIKIFCEEEWKKYKNKDCVITKCKYEREKGCWFVLFKDMHGYRAFYKIQDKLYITTQNWKARDIIKSYKDSFYDKDDKLYEEFWGEIVLDAI